MSQRTFGSSEFGCLIQGKDVDYFIKKYIELNPSEFEDCEKPEDMRECMEEWLSCNEFFNRSSNAGNPVSETERREGGFYAQLMHDGCYYPSVCFLPIKEVDEYQEVDIDELPVVLVSADKGLTTKCVLRGDFYSTKEEIVEEFKDKLERYLPEDFDWEHAIADVDYAIFC